VAGCCECCDEPSGSCATELVNELNSTVQNKTSELNAKVQTKLKETKNLKVREAYLCKRH
jgi:hypothetical protein